MKLLFSGLFLILNSIFILPNAYSDEGKSAEDNEVVVYGLKPDDFIMILENKITLSDYSEIRFQGKPIKVICEGNKSKGRSFTHEETLSTEYYCTSFEVKGALMASAIMGAVNKCSEKCNSCTEGSATIPLQVGPRQTIEDDDGNYTIDDVIYGNKKQITYTCKSTGTAYGTDCRLY